MKRSPLILKPTPEQLRTGSTLRRAQDAALTRKPIAREAVVRLRTPLAKVSAKQAAENRERTRVLAVLRARYPVCQRCGVRPSAEGHEPRTRARGGSAVDPANIVMLCNFPDGGCHRWIHTHIAEATKEGWLVSRWAG